MSYNEKKKNKLHYDVGDYIITNRRIGKGSFSTIYLGYDKYNTKKKVAIKKMIVENISKLNKQIKREIELHEKINHRNIIKIHNVIYDNTIYNQNVYIILEYCKVGDFYTFQKKRPIREYFIKKYVNDMTEGLQYLFNKKIMHRDLKTKNLLVSDCGDIKIADFGFAKIFNDEHLNPDLKQTYCGSPLYMAPEILYYQKYDNKSDLWSVGIIIYEMITGNPPYHVKNFYQLMKELEKGEIKLPLKYQQIISKQLQYLLSYLLVKNPKNRMEWEDYFKYKWIYNNKLKDENDLININMETCKSLPILNKNFYDTKNIFYKFDTLHSSNDKFKKTIDETNKMNQSNNNYLKKDNDKNQNQNLKLNFTNELSSVKFEQNKPMSVSYCNDIIGTNQKPNSKINVKLNDINLNFNLVFNSSLCSDKSDIEENEMYLSAKSNFSDSDDEIESDIENDIENDIINSSNSFELLNNFSSELNSINTSLNSPLKNEKTSSKLTSSKPINIKNKQINLLNKNMNQNSNTKKKNKKKSKKQIFRNGIFYNSINVLKESYDYLSSHNKSI